MFFCSCMCIQRRFKVACTSAQSDQSLRFLPEETLDPWLPTECLSKADLTAQMCRLIESFDWHICQLVPFAGNLPNA